MTRWLALLALTACTVTPEGDAATDDPSTDPAGNGTSDTETEDSREETEDTGEELVVDTDDDTALPEPEPEATLYWGASYCSESGRIATSDGSGGEDRTVLAMVSPDSVRDLVLDTRNDEIWWVLGGSSKNDDDRIMKAHLDGTGIETVLARENDELRPESLQIDFDDRNLYWLTRDTIEKANLDGSSASTIVTLEDGDNRNVSEIAIDAQGNRIYWTDRQFTPLLERAQLNGNGRETLVPRPNGIGGAQALTLDLVHDHIYWLEGGAFLPCNENSCPRIRRSNLDGSDATTILNLSLGGDKDYARGIAVDPIEGKIYWSQAEFCPDGDGTGRIFRANLDGSGVETVHDGLGVVTTLEVVPAP